MENSIRIIHLEDVKSDAEIIRREINKGGYPFEVKWVTTRDTFKAALSEFSPDIILSDHSLPGFSSVEAYHLLRDSGLDVPFIVVTATMSEEFAVMMMKEGVSDYLLKDRLQRLPSAVMNAIEKWKAERERRNSVILVEQNERRFRALIENSHDMIGVTDEQLKPIFASSSYTRITGRTIEERRRGDGIDSIHPDDRTAYYSVIEKAKMAPGRYFHVSYRMLNKDRKYIWVEGTIVNMLQEEAIRGILFNLRDITARKEAEESLIKSQAHIAAIIENSNVSVYSIDRQFRYLSFNSLLAKNLKQAYGLEIKIGDPVFEFLTRLDPSELDGWKKVYTDAFKGNRVEFEKEFRFGDFQNFQAFSINPIVEGHYVTGLSCFAWDVTPQRLAALKIAQSEARFRALIEYNSDAIVMRDADRRVVYGSPAITRLVGIPLEELIGSASMEFSHPDDFAAVKQAYDNVNKYPGQAFTVTIRIRHRNGHYIWVESTLINMLDNENVKGYVINLHDISERKEAEIQRERITLDLIERNRNLEQYAYIVSHNLRAPVANILGLCNIIELPGRSEGDRDASIVHLLDSTRRLDDVIKDLNMILQLRQNINEKKEEVNLQELVTDIQSDISELIAKSNVEITTNFKRVKSIATVKSYLHSIFYNLITNSIKYKQDGVRPVIKITTEQAGDRIMIRFVDNGLGIDLERQSDKIFGLYKRFHPDHAEGKGVGLFMTKTQVEALGGKISVKSQVNIGTEFIVEL